MLLLAIFPRGEKPNPQREKIQQVNATIAGLGDDQRVFFMDIGNKFLEPDGTLSKEVMPDFLHLSPKGYQIWADAISPKLAELMKLVQPARVWGGAAKVRQTRAWRPDGTIGSGLLGHADRDPGQMPEFRSR